ncbi:hypothetical protein ACIRQP_35375 [Streptomyces sp. NPDC102274]|uniref:hypothetical protein n=1 Tax=Streptomyces sp. NPDC102274 TaxID=3366151 RepID=UPI00380CFED0
MKGKRGEAFAYGAITVVLFGAAVSVGRWVLPGAEQGDVDPVGIVIGLTASAVSVWTGWFTVRSLRWQGTNLAEVAERLAVEMLDAERTARRQLLGDLHACVQAAPTLPGSRSTAVNDTPRSVRVKTPMGC